MKTKIKNIMSLLPNQIKLVIGLLLAMVLFLVFNVIKLRAFAPVYGYYDDPNRSTSTVISDYHNYVNGVFNEYTKVMISASISDKRGDPPEKAENCPNDPSSNFSTFCLAVNLLGDDGKNDRGYINYKNALQKRRNDLVDKAEKDPTNPFSQAALNMMDSMTAVRNFAIKKTNLDHEIDAAKKALDVSLATYDELRVLYPMHKEYLKIFDALVNYRDKLVEVRKQTDQFPATFIDVTTSKCT